MKKELGEESPAGEAAGRLDSWKEIAAYLNRGVRTVIRWEQDEGLPVHRLQHDRRGSVYAYKRELDAWQRSRSGLPQEEERPRVRRGFMAGVVVAALVLAAGGGAWWLGRGPGAAVVKVTRLTAYSGMEITPSLSPDGRMVAFSWNGPGEENYDIYVQLVGSGTPLRLTREAGRDLSPAWSPDGRTIAYVRLLPDLRLGVFTVPSLGGAERKVGTVTRPTDVFPLRLNWTPDGQWIIAGSHADGWSCRLHLIPAQGGAPRVWTRPAEGVRDLSGAVSPDGRRLAFLRSGDGNSWRVHVVELGPDYEIVGEARAVGPPRYSRLEPAWSADGRTLYLLREEGGVLSMLAAGEGGLGRPRVVSGGWPAGWVEASLRPELGRVVLSDGWMDRDLWRFDLRGRKAAVRIAGSTASEMNPQYSPDGRKLAFSSRRSGVYQIWVADADGRNERQLTELPSLLTGMPRWSPDAKRIAFDARVEGRDGVWVVNAEGGEPRWLGEAAGGFNPSWSRDGQFLYYCSRASGRAEIWRVPVAAEGGGGKAARVTKTEGWNAFESPDGRYLYYVQRYHNGAILRMPAGGGEAEVVVERVNVLHNFAVTEEGIYYGLAENAAAEQAVWFYSFGTGKSMEVVKTGRRGGLGLTVAPGGGEVICTLTETRGGDLWLVEGFGG